MVPKFDNLSPGLRCVARAKISYVAKKIPEKRERQKASHVAIFVSFGFFLQRVCFNAAATTTTATTTTTCDLKNNLCVFGKTPCLQYKISFFLCRITRVITRESVVIIVIIVWREMSNPFSRSLRVHCDLWRYLVLCVFFLNLYTLNMSDSFCARLIKLSRKFWVVGWRFCRRSYGRKWKNFLIMSFGWAADKENEML